jgi:DnaJ-domain-containing protein 1
VSVSDAFSTLGLAPQFALDLRDLEQKQRELYVACSRGDVSALEDINEAYRVLKSPVSRAELLFERRGWSIISRPNPDVLMEVFAERENIDFLRTEGDVAALDAWVLTAQQRKEALVSSLGLLLDGNDNPSKASEATQLLEQLRFLTRAIAAAESAISTLEDPENV